MAFSAYKHRADVQSKLGLRIERANFIPQKVVAVKPMEWFSQYMNLVNPYHNASEKARSEFLIAPILIEAVRPFTDRFSVVSGPILQAPDAESKRQGLSGTVDFAICREQDTFELQCPIAVVVESKKGEIELGYWQCVAEMYAARRYNEKKGKPTPTMYGCVSIGTSWQFLRLHENELLLENDFYSISNLGELLGAWHAILNAAKAE